MPIITVVFGLLLCGLSCFSAVVKAGGIGPAMQDLGGTFAPGTWLIPAGFGVLLIVLGLVATKGGGARKHAMHTAALIGTIGGLLCLGQGIMQLIKLAKDEPVKLNAMSAVWGMAIICITFVGVCVQSFISARKARELAASSAPKAD